jgi:hypothetical protein
VSERPLAIDLFSGLHGWAEGLIDAGWRVIGFDLVDMSKEIGHPKPDHFNLVIQDVLTIHGSQFKSAQLIVSSSPCTAYSYMAMPWSRAKAKAAAIRADDTGEEMRKLNALYDAQFRIQREASEAAGRHIPMIVENVRGAQPWVGRAVDSYGSYFLWGDVPLIPTPQDAIKVPGFRFDGSGGSFQTAAVNGMKAPGGRHIRDGAKSTARLTNPSEHRKAIPQEGRKHVGDWFRDPTCPTRQGGQIKAKVPLTSEGRKNTGGSWFKIGGPGQVSVNNNPDGRQWARDPVAATSSGSPKRKAASAKIAKIPLTLSRHIGHAMHPQSTNRCERPRQVNLFGDWLNE